MRSVIPSKTSVEEFDGFVSLVSYLPGLHFVPVRRNGKSPEIPKGESWKDDSFRLGKIEARARLDQGKNVGLVLKDDLVVLDIDDGDKAHALLNDSLWDTLSVSTRSNATHLYYVNGGVANADIPKVVEVRARWRYVLAPGSFVPPDKTKGNGLYEISNFVKPQMIFPSDLPAELRPPPVEGDVEFPVLAEPGEPVRNRHNWALEDICGEDEKLDALLGELNPGGYPSVSEADFATCVRLLYWEVSPGQVKDILREFRGRSKVIERPDYVDRTVKNARSRVGKTISNRVNVNAWQPSNIFDKIQTEEKTRSTTPP